MLQSFCKLMKFERLEVLIDVTVLKLSFKDYVFYFRS